MQEIRDRKSKILAGDVLIANRGRHMTSSNVRDEGGALRINAYEINVDDTDHICSIRLHRRLGGN